MDPPWSTCFDSRPFAWIPTQSLCLSATFPSSTFVDRWKYSGVEWINQNLRGKSDWKQKNTIGPFHRWKKMHLLYHSIPSFSCVLFFWGCYDFSHLKCQTWSTWLFFRASNFCGRLSLKIHCFVEKPPPWRECLRTCSDPRSSTIQTTSDFSGVIHAMTGGEIAPKFPFGHLTFSTWKIWGDLRTMLQIPIMVKDFHGFSKTKWLYYTLNTSSKMNHTVMCHVSWCICPSVSAMSAPRFGLHIQGGCFFVGIP